MTRAVPEWIGATPDTPAPPRVRLRVFEAYGGICALTGRKITPADKWELDHATALVNGGENRESNLQPVLSDAHKRKTAEDVATKAKDRRVRAKHIGAKAPPRQRLPGSRDGRWKRKINGTVERRDD